jgi:hypothetical protein
VPLQHRNAAAYTDPYTDTQAYTDPHARFGRRVPPRIPGGTIALQPMALPRPVVGRARSQFTLGLQVGAASLR